MPKKWPLSPQWVVYYQNSVQRSCKQDYLIPLCHEKSKLQEQDKPGFKNKLFFNFQKVNLRNCGAKYRLHSVLFLIKLAHYVRSLENFADREGDALCLLSLKVRDIQGGGTRWNTGYNHSWYYTDVFRCTKVFTCLQNFKCEMLYTTSFHAIRNENGLCYTS